MIIERLGAYRKKVLELYPALPTRLEYRMSLKDADAIALYALLGRHPADLLLHLALLLRAEPLVSLAPLRRHRVG
jgi:hypothetical protein